MGKNVITPHFPNTRAYTDTRSPQGELGYTFCNLYEVQPLKKKKKMFYKEWAHFTSQVTASSRKLANPGSLLNRKGFSQNLSKQPADPPSREPVGFTISVGSGVRQTWVWAPPVLSSHL